METESQKITKYPFEAPPRRDSAEYASIEEMIGELFEDQPKSKPFSWPSILPSAQVLWELLAAIGFAVGGLLSTGHPFVAVMAAGAVPFAMHMLRLLAAGIVGYELTALFRRIFR